MQTDSIFDELFQRTKSGEVLSSSSPSAIDLKAYKKAAGEFLGHSPSELTAVTDSTGMRQRERILEAMKIWAARQRLLLEVCEYVTLDHNDESLKLIMLTDNRGKRTWKLVETSPLDSIAAISKLRGKKLWLVPSGAMCDLAKDIVESGYQRLAPDIAEFMDQALVQSEYQPPASSPLNFEPQSALTSHSRSTDNPYLSLLESESIGIFREAVAAGRKACMLFSMGKDSMAMLRLAQKAFAPNPIPFPLVVIDTRWKFQDMYRFRDFVQSQSGLEVIVHINPEAIERDVNPFDFGSGTHTQITKTEALRQVLDAHGFDVIFGGGRRDEEKSRAKERIFSVRGQGHIWNPREQRPELWSAYNTTLTEEQTLRVFPISNWTEVDIWRYIEQEQIPLVPLYFAKRRPVVKRNGSLLAIDDERIAIGKDEVIDFDWVRFRTLGCYPLTGATYSQATDVHGIVQELEQSDTSERISRIIDFDAGASMEQKKREGYF